MEKESYKTKYNRYYMRDYYKKNKDTLNQQRLISYYRTRYGIDDVEDIKKFKAHSRCYRTLMKFSDEEIAEARAGKECHWRLRDVVAIRINLKVYPYIEPKGSTKYLNLLSSSITQFP